MRAAGGKAPGQDRLTIDMLKVLMWEENGVLGALCGLAFQLGVQTAHVTKGVITMIPKGPVEGEVDVTDMRPITLLSEMGKIPARILADRISKILCSRPELCTQRNGHS